MARQRVLVVDADESFVDWFREALAYAELEIHVADSADDALAKVRRLHDDIIFIAVDLPTKNGFGLFSRIKGLARRARVVLATSTISPVEMSFHQRLRVHADAYLDKRTLGEEELIDTIYSLAGLEPVQTSQELEDLRRAAMKALQGEIDELSQRLDAAQRDKVEFLERENEHKRSLEATEASLRAAQEASRELEQKLTRQILQVTEDLNRERQAHEKSVQRQRREFDKLLGRFEALNHRHSETRSSLREEHEPEVASLKKQHGKTPAERDRDLQAALSSAAEEREKALSAAEKHRVD